MPPAARVGIIAMVEHFTTRKRGGPRGGSRSARLRYLAAAIALLGQVQLFCLAGFHYHPDLPGPSRSATPTASAQRHSGAPVEDARSCPFCQVIRHNPVAASSAFHFSLNTLSTARLAPAALARPSSAPQVRLPGRDPPLSFSAAC